MPAFITDSGPLVSLLDRCDKHHAWTKAQFNEIPCPLLTCDGVIAEAAYLLNSARVPPWSVLELLRRNVIKLNFDLTVNSDRVLALMQKYSDTPMDFVDGCLVVMTEQKRECRLITIDSDFQIYRRFERQTIPLIIPNR
jgi:predicted nucleic acid-binding protein